MRLRLKPKQGKAVAKVIAENDGAVELSQQTFGGSEVDVKVGKKSFTVGGGGKVTEKS